VAAAAASPMVPPSQGLPVAAALLGLRDWRALGADLAQDIRWPRWEAGHVGAGLGDDLLGGGDSDAGISSSWAT